MLLYFLKDGSKAELSRNRDRKVLRKVLIVVQFVYKGANEYYVQWSIMETTYLSVELCNETKPHISSQDFSSQISETPSGIVTVNTVGTPDTEATRHHVCFKRGLSLRLP